MHYLGARLTGSTAHHQPQDESMPGEPAPDFAQRTATDVLEALDGEVKQVDVVRVIDRRWLAPDALSREFDAFLAAFIARGGRVEFVDAVDDVS